MLAVLKTQRNPDGVHHRKHGATNASGISNVNPIAASSAALVREVTGSVRTSAVGEGSKWI